MRCPICNVRILTQLGLLKHAQDHVNGLSAFMGENVEAEFLPPSPEPGTKAVPKEGA